MRKLAIALAACAAFLAPAAMAAPAVAPKEGDFVVRDFKFHSGEILPELRLHYTTFGEPKRDAAGRVTNAVMMLHGTGGTAQAVPVNPVRRRAVRLPASRWTDQVLHHHAGRHRPRRSTKPSDGLRAKFPKYDYDDMVEAQHRLLTEGLNVDHLRLILGTSMGCMHAFVWGETYPDFADALMPLACEPTRWPAVTACGASC
jgi:homoserine O-acetyltransferase